MAKRKTTYMPLSEIMPADRNAKRHADDNIKASIRRFGFLDQPILDGRTGKLIAGHGRLENLTLMHAAAEPVPEGITVNGSEWLVPLQTGWSSVDDYEAEAAGIELNRSTELGGWDLGTLSTQLLDIQEHSAHGIEGVGFTAADIDGMLATLERERERAAAASEGDADEQEPLRPPARPKTKPGDVWMLGPHTLVCGDCRDRDVVRTAVDGRRVNLAFTSPPYASQREYDEESGFRPIPEDEYVEWFAPVAANVADVLADDGSWFVNIKPSAGGGLDTSLYVFDLVVAHVRAWGWHFATELTWERNGVPKQVTQRFKNQFEPIYQFARGQWKMRPDNVKFVSDHAIAPLGPGYDTGHGGVIDHDARKNSGTMSKVQGEPGGPNVGKRGRRAPAYVPQGQGGAEIGDSQSERNRAIQLGSLQAQRPRVGVVVGGVVVGGVGEDEQGSGVGAYGPGEGIGLGFAYPGNRLPTFAGTHEAVGHSAAFPVGLPAFFVRAYTDEGDVVFDPFMGSGSTLLAAHENDRVAVGIEVSPKYCDVICARFQRRTGIVPTRRGRAVDFS